MTTVWLIFHGLVSSSFLKTSNQNLYNCKKNYSECMGCYNSVIYLVGFLSIYTLRLDETFKCIKSSHDILVDVKN